MTRLITSFIAVLLTLVPIRAGLAQTYDSSAGPLNVEVMASGLNHPWALAFLPDGTLLVTERSGALRLIQDKIVGPPIGGLPRLQAERQGGMLDVVLDPDFATNNLIYFSYSKPAARGSGTAVGRAELIREGLSGRLFNRTDIFTLNKPTRSGAHYGSRLAIAPDGTMFVTIGDRGDRDRAQDPQDHAGSVVRINRNGTVPDDNPFADGASALAEIWSIGHRNPQGATIHPNTGQLWTVEHGARGGDEINTPKPGRNYGWPVISYGRHYTGFKIGEGKEKDGMEQPEYYWDPSIAPSGLDFYDGDVFADWRGDLLVGALKDQMLVRLEMDDGVIVGEERLLADQFGRIRDVRTGPDGAIWLLTDEDEGQVLRISPAT